MPREQKKMDHASQEQKNKDQDDKESQESGNDTQNLQSAQDTGVKKKRASPPSSGKEVTIHKMSLRNRKMSQEAPSTTNSGGTSTSTPKKRGNKKIKEKQLSSEASPSTVTKPQKECLNNTVCELVKFMMLMYKKKRHVLKTDMLKMIETKHRKFFPEILRRASFNIEVVFGVDVKEMDPIKHSYLLVSKMNLPNNGMMNRGRGYPKTGLLMDILGVIFLAGNRASEQKIWEFLNKMKIYDGKRHFLFGEPRKLIIEEFVKLEYLEYRQILNSEPASYEFLWGPRSHAETTKMKILEFFAKINHTVPSAFQSRYEEALKEEEERYQASVTH